MHDILNRLDNIVNIKTGEKRTSIITILCLFYLISMSSYMRPLLPSQVQREAITNRSVQHILGMATIFVLINLLADELDMKTTFAYTIICYGLFLLTSKLDLSFTVVIAIGSFIYYLFEKKTNKKNLSDLVPASVKNTIKDNAEFIRLVIFTLLTVALVTGVTQYSSRKEVEYKKDFDLLKFLLAPSNRQIKRAPEEVLILNSLHKSDTPSFLKNLMKR